MSSNVWHRVLAIIVFLSLTAGAQAATIGSSLAARLQGAGDTMEVGVVIVSFKTTGPVDASHVAILQQLGIARGIVLRELGMVAVPATAGQVQSLAANSAVQSIWANEPLKYFMNQARMLTGVEKLRDDGKMTTANGGLPVTGSGDFSVVVNDSGIDATHADLKFGGNVIQNVQIVTDTDTLSGFTPLVTLDNIPDTDTHVGHGTHCAGIVGGTGERSAGLYGGVAPGAKLIGTGSGAGLFILSALGGFEWSLAHQGQYKIRVISNSWGGSGAFEPDNPINLASKRAYTRNIAVVFAAGNSGPGPDTLNPYAKAPWVIGVAAGTKEGGLAGFSSRGTPASRRLHDSDPLNDYDAPTITAPGTGREFDANADKFTAAIVSTRAASNVVANGLTDDTEIPPQYVPFYTQISGTSMATPFVAGVVALMLDADPTLTPDQIKTFLTDTASMMPGYEEYEVGAGYVNAFAAVDKVFRKTKAYGTFTRPAFNYPIDTTWGEAERFAVDFTPQPPGPTSSNTYRFSVEAGTGILDVRIDGGTNDATAETGNSLGLMLYAPDGTTYSAGIALPILDAPRREVIVRYPMAGEWVAEVRGLRGLTLAGLSPSSPVGLAVPERVDGLIYRATVDAAPVGDIAGHPAEALISNALLTRQMDVLSDGLFHPDSKVTRADFAEHLTFDTPVRQTRPDAAVFTDVAGTTRYIAESVTAKGSNLRDFGFESDGMMSPASGRFNPSGSLKRIDLAVALVRALGLDAQAKALAGTMVTATVNGQSIVLADNDQIPLALRGYVQIALDRQILQAFYALEQGPLDFQPTLTARVKPSDPTTRAFMAVAFAHYREQFASGQ